jgi:hypothetical protein
MLFYHVVVDLADWTLGHNQTKVHDVEAVADVEAEVTVVATSKDAGANYDELRVSTGIE